jgi:uncharacterized membrane protein YdjX (TVP38/TMEM64 family)
MKKVMQYVVIALFVLSTIGFLYCAITGTCISPEVLEYYARILRTFVNNHYFVAVVGYVAIYSVCIMILFPLLAPFTILGGYLFGVFWGVFYSCLASLIGSLISFAAFRYLLASHIRRVYHKQIAWFNERIKEGGGSYLLILHFLLVPFSVINMGAALTHVSWWTFSWTTVVGSIPISLVYAFAGQQLHKIGNRPIFSSKVLGILLLLIIVACIPLIIRRFSKRSKEVSVPK